MEFQGKTVHLSEVVTRRGDKTYRSFYLRHAYRENGQIKKETLLKLTAEEAERFQAVFGAPRVAAGMPVGIAERACRTTTPPKPNIAKVPGSIEPLRSAKHLIEYGRAFPSD